MMGIAMSGIKGLCDRTEKINLMEIELDEHVKFQNHQLLRLIEENQILLDRIASMEEQLTQLDKLKEEIKLIKQEFLTQTSSLSND